MRKKIWVVSPLFYLMALGMLVMSVVSFRYNKILFTIEITVSLLAISAVAVSDIVMRNNVSSAVKGAKKVLSAEDEISLGEFPLPVAVVAPYGDIVWANTAFAAGLCGGESYMGEDILKFIYPKTIRQIAGEKGTSISYGDNEYTVYGIKTENCHILYFIDDTYYKRINREYRDKKPVVCLAVFDNREEIARGSVGGEDSRINAEVEAAVRNWGINEMGGFMRKLDSSRYLVVTDESHIEKAKQKRFQVLDYVREIKSPTMSATISIGVGRGAADVAESERYARQALDMALGRGGDQVAIMQKGEAFEFFGGLSKGVEKRDKVRTRVIASAITDHVNTSDRVFIMGHKNSDLDSVGSAVGMWAVINKGLEKPAYIVINKQTTLASQLVKSVEAEYPDESVFISPQDAIGAATDNSLLIVVDTHSTGFVESNELLERLSRIIIIDHHRMMVSHIKNSLIFYHEPYASSAAEMVSEIVQYIRSSAIDAVDAQAMLAGIMLDTKSFVLKTGVRTFEAAAFLKRCGADTVEVKKMFADSLEMYQAKSQLVSKAEIYNGCAIATYEDDLQEVRVTAAQAADELLTIMGVVASFVLYKSGNGVSISGRSLGDVNVQIILEAFGGGGHFTMAGAQIPNISLNEAKRALIKQLDEKLEQVTARD